MPVKFKAMESHDSPPLLLRRRNDPMLASKPVTTALFGVTVNAFVNNYAYRNEPCSIVPSPFQVTILSI